MPAVKTSHNIAIMPERSGAEQPLHLEKSGSVSQQHFLTSREAGHRIIESTVARRRRAMSYFTASFINPLHWITAWRFAKSSLILAETSSVYPSLPQSLSQSVHYLPTCIFSLTSPCLRPSLLLSLFLFMLLPGLSLSIHLHLLSISLFLSLPPIPSSCLLEIP